MKTESDYSYHTTPWWQLYYIGKWFRPMLRAARSSGLEEYFAKMDFEFADPPLSKSEEVTIAATGDVMFRREITEANGSKLWDEIGRDLFGADLSIGNLEFSVNPDWLIEKLLRFSVPASFAMPLIGDDRFGRFDVFTLANNHINDSLSKGIESTCDFVDSQGIARAGASKSREEQEQVTILERGGAKIAVLAYTFSTNNIPLEPGFEHGTNVIRFNALDDADFDPSLVLRHIEKAKQQGADYIIACNHWGIDLEHYPPPRLVERAHQLLDAGVDLIIGHHPHVVGQMERYRTPDGRNCIVLYSLGNFTARGLPFILQRLGQIAHVTLEVGVDSSGNRKVRPRKLTMTPIFHSQNRGPTGMSNRVISVNRAARLIQDGKAPPHYTRKDIKALQKLDRYYRENFTFKGVFYR
ncbi:MAG: CapA family protein [Deltaproteobacteria bacterium]|nr:CapA family protein [Deltaproteobacteria bacterium]